MGNGRPVKPARHRIWVENEDYEIIKALGESRRVTGRLSYTPLKEIIADLLEVAYRCIEDHGADFSKPAKHHQAREHFKRLASRAAPKGKPRKRGQRGKDQKPRKRRTK